MHLKHNAQCPQNSRTNAARCLTLWTSRISGLIIRRKIGYNFEFIINMSKPIKILEKLYFEFPFFEKQKFYEADDSCNLCEPGNL